MLFFLKKYNFPLILISISAAIILGITTPTIFSSIYILGDIFINLLKLFALPLICSSLITIFAQMSNLNKMGSIVKKVSIYIVLSEIMAVSIALILFNVFHPGHNVNPSLILQNKPISPINHTINLSGFLLSIVPHNIFESLVKFELLPVVIFSIMFGIALAQLKSHNELLINFFKEVRQVSNICLHGVMYLAPIGIFALIGSGISQSVLSQSLSNSLIALLLFVVVLVIGLLLHGLWQFVGVIILTKNSISEVLKHSLIVFTTAFATSSSIATLPCTIDASYKLKGKREVVEFMLPFCASINVGGMMMYEVAATLFFTQVLGIDLSLPHQILIAFACILGGIAEGGIPETSLVSLMVVFRIVNIPLTAISFLLPLDRIIDRFRTMINIFGNMCGVIIVSSFIKKQGRDG